MFETDFPHPTCLAPGPASYTDSAKVVIEQGLSDLPEELLKKILRDNAARVYRLD
jgi:predicted TIM-barrel fold metal-dependent hydrolase